MKRQLVFLVALFTTTTLCAQMVRVSGKLTNNWKEVTLYKTEDGKADPYATTKVGTDGLFGFQLEVDEAGFYKIGTDREDYNIWLEPGDEVNIEIAPDRVQLVGKNSKENKALYEWENLAYKVRAKSENWRSFTGISGKGSFKDFYPDLTALLEKAPAVKAEFKTGNKKFDQLMKIRIDYLLDFFALQHKYTPRSVHPKADEVHPFYATILQPEKFADNVVLQFPEGRRMLNLYAMHGVISNHENGKELDNYLKYLGCEQLKGEYVLYHSKLYKSYDQYETMMKKYGSYFITPNQQSRAKAVGESLFSTISNVPGYNFTYPDINGKEVSFSDFKGKVVVVDVWATWCGPCKSELPYLKKLEEEMEGTDVVFIALSVDKAKDTEKWKTFVRENEMKGIQLHASEGFNSQIMKEYKINGIPRFMVFDRKGNIVSVDAPRPSSPALKQMLMKTLNK